MNIEIKNNNGSLSFNIRAMDEQERELLTFIIADAERNIKKIKLHSHCFSNSQVHSILIGFENEKT